MILPQASIVQTTYEEVIRLTEALRAVRGDGWLLAQEWASRLVEQRACHRRALSAHDENAGRHLAELQKLCAEADKWLRANNMER